MRMKAALAIYLVIGTINLLLGVRYFSSNQFMPYHAEAVGASWQELDSGVQSVFLAIMKVAGGGWLTLGFFTIIVAFSAFKKCSIFARWMLPAGTILFWSISFVATWGVHQQTGASTPWAPSLAMIGFALIALALDAPWSSRVQGIK